MFKKMLVSVLAASMIFSLTACSNNKGNNGGNNAAQESQGNQTVLTGSAAEVLQSVVADTEFAKEMALGEAMEIDLTDADAVPYYTGLKSADNVEEAAFVEPMMGSIPLSIVLVKAKDGADIDAMKEEILNGVDFRKWICVEAEKVVVNNSGNYILMAMASESNTEDAYNAFVAKANDLVGEKLELATGGESF